MTNSEFDDEFGTENSMEIGAEFDTAFPADFGVDFGAESVPKPTPGNSLSNSEPKSTSNLVPISAQITELISTPNLTQILMQNPGGRCPWGWPIPARILASGPDPGEGSRIPGFWVPIRES